MGATNRIRAVIWDVDGTLSDTHDLCVMGLQRAIATHGGPELDPPEVVALFGPTEEGILRSVVPAAADAAIETYVEIYERGHGNGVGFDGVTELVHELDERGIRQGVVTGKGARTASITLAALGLDSILDPIVAGSEHGSIKARAIGAVVEEWGMDPGEVAYIGDVASDTYASRSAGVRAVAVAWKPSADVAALAASEPDALVVDVAGLRAWIAAQIDE